LALLFSWSKGTWLGFAVGIASLALFLPKRIWTGAAVLVLLAAVGGGMFLVADSAGIVPSGIVERVTNLNQGVALTDVRGVDINDSNFSVLERLAHWQAAIDMARDHPWFGVGFGNYEAAYGKYALINWPQALGHAHNYYLNLLAEVGLIGLSMYLLFWLAVFWQTIRMTRRHDWPERGIALGLLAAWTAFSVHHLVDKLYVNNIYLQLGVMFALLHQLDTNEENGELDDAMSRGLA
jgi:O-antigen ligase